ncbi:MAG TPA: hypothetical protein VD766_05210 [Solirubrobacterales bacterium]|nr:hypothetical protein [Solirubrobacterales bacterium]
MRTHDEVDAHLSTPDHPPRDSEHPLLFFGIVLALWVSLRVAVYLLV